MWVAMSTAIKKSQSFPIQSSKFYSKCVEEVPVKVGCWYVVNIFLVQAMFSKEREKSPKGECA